MSRSFKLTVAYDGTDFAGWQVQPGKNTIQSALQDALQRVAKESVSVVGSGRTDAGVHALAQVASCRLTQWRASAAALARALNTYLPNTIVVREAIDAPDGFHAIGDATGKRYRYQLQIGGTRDVFQYRYRWLLHEHLDVDAMRQAASHFLGQHDFASFQASGSAPKKTTVRNIRVCELIDQPSMMPDTLHLALEVEANGFLYNMVRNIVGTLVEIGRGKHPPQWIDEVIAAADRSVAGPTAPPQGLFLVRVDYPPLAD
ncbi:MAG: tRNA pseudouridine(38-40) synthase TruA [Pirellulales bacterium]|nr:tRNA pseudouridine(38-40) synthase TruA [Pirellulales bacterium]